MISSVMAFRWISLVALSLTLASCTNLGFDGPRRQFSGVWLYEFEGSTFVEGATGIPDERPAARGSDWLEYRFDQPYIGRLVDDTAYDDRRDCYTVQPFLVTFMGHRTHRPFGAGHMGLWRSEVTVHTTISFKRLGPAFGYNG